MYCFFLLCHLEELWCTYLKPQPFTAIFMSCLIVCSALSDWFQILLHLKNLSSTVYTKLVDNP